MDAQAMLGTVGIGSAGDHPGVGEGKGEYAGWMHNWRLSILRESQSIMHYGSRKQQDHGHVDKD